ncbi:PilZ domain-containing protein [Paenibacillus profundus]|uniref:PilZ domain-containing protein n=1 Tax=Paenibacillus profundus TaxID=1173085 RepID=A0ABS8YNN2_9BACL|nr:MULTISPECIES: PilZ domain-containing protein [Paenibacillus]MCE5171922.1 PilZ domain-containing protein [Paenibacillus profundus]MCM3341392.1 PilZ domain-containing protein [Paenibacillus sp. MER TA 81-3]
MKDTYFTDTPEYLLITLLHSRTVLEGDSCVATGVLSYMEGDLIEVGLPEFERFELGEAIKVTIYSPVGIFNFTTKVVARHQGSLLIIHPPQQQRKFADKREYPRIDVNKQGVITSRQTMQGEINALSTPVQIHIQDISLNGLGFTMTMGSALREGMQADAELQLGFVLPCRLHVVRHFPREEEMFCGAKLILNDDESMRSLRAFILREQIKAHIERKTKREIRG